jgi:hypothetical protein
MRYEEAGAGRIGLEASGDGSFWTYDALQERLVETVRQWWRMPGGGAWPFASDGPWHLIRKQWEDWDARDPKPLRPLPLRRAEMREMEEATEWLTMVPEEDRRVVVLGLLQLAGGRKRISWAAMLRPMGMARGAGGLARRYERALGVLAMRLNGVSEARARAMVLGRLR